jgi:hypothetical protein
MPDLTRRPLLRCPDCGRAYPGLRRAPAGVTVSPRDVRCVGCGREHVVCVAVGIDELEEAPRG